MKKEYIVMIPFENEGDANSCLRGMSWAGTVVEEEKGWCKEKTKRK